MVKIMKTHNGEILKDMKQTYSLVRELEHENIIKMKSMFLNNQKQQCQIVMEDIGASDLRQYMRSLKAKN